jgi:ribosome silencing factor RsfS/YbeB/iojap
MSIEDRVENIVNQIDSKKGEDIEVFNLDGIDYITNRVIITTSLSSKHTLSLAYHLKDELKKSGEKILYLDEGEDWVVLDLGDIIIHIMSQEYRQKYSIENFLSELSS